MSIFAVENTESLRQLSPHPMCTILDSAKYLADTPDRHLALRNAQGQTLARCSLWWRQTPLLDTRHTGFVGHFDCCDKRSGALLLEHSCGLLRQTGCDVAIGPVDGSTWKSYRFVTAGDDEPPFFLEPTGKPECRQAFEQQGFKVLAGYVSVRNDELRWTDPGIDAAAAALRQQGLRLQHIDMNVFEDELARIHELSLRSFADNFLFSPIDRDAFIAMYRPLRAVLVPELVLFVTRGTRLIGFIFAIPDLNQAQRGETVDTVIIKTLAVDPDFAGRRIGSWLAKSLYQQAGRMGFRRAVHALMHEENISRTIHSDRAQVIRRYSLLFQQLADAP